MSLLSQFYPNGNGYGSTPGAKIPVEIVLVGGGGGGGSGVTGAGVPAGWKGGGGGGGGLVLYKKFNARVGVPYPISIGAGGAGSPAGIGALGQNTTFDFITGFGGGGGEGYQSMPNEYFYNEGSAFGSNGGKSNNQDRGAKGWIESGVYRYRGAGLAARSPLWGAGGGGAGGSGYMGRLTKSSGETPGVPQSMDGAAGISLLEFVGIDTTVGGGGGGGREGGPPSVPSAFTPRGSLGLGADGGGNGGGWNATAPLIVNANAGSANRGGGGGGGWTDPGNPGGAGGAGGSGLLIVRYPTDYASATVVGDAPTPPQPGFYVYRWNSGPGSITFN